MKVKHTIHIHYSKYEWETKPEYLLYSHKFEDTDYRIHIGSQEVEIEIPDSFDPRSKQIEALEKEKKAVMAKYQKTVAEINTRISKLQAITYEGVA